MLRIVNERRRRSAKLIPAVEALAEMTKLPCELEAWRLLPPITPGRELSRLAAGGGRGAVGHAPFITSRTI
jgi:hypothetical protein